MGWSLGECEDRIVGYACEATCDHPGCTVEIDRGLGYACCDQHGEDTNNAENCAGYFCSEHEFAHDCRGELTGEVLRVHRAAPEASASK